MLRYFTAKTILVRCGKPGGGKGALVQHELSATLSTSNVQTLFTDGGGMDDTVEVIGWTRG